MADLGQQVNNYLFLDLSSKASGWCVADQDGNTLDYGCITSSSSDVLKRVSIMASNIYDIIKKYNIKYLIAEEVRQEQSNSRTQKVLMWVQGAVLLKMYEADPTIEYQFIQPNSWRSHIGIKTGRGIKRDELKKADIEYVNNKYHLDITSDDIADAICIKDSYFIQQKPAWA